MNGHGCNGCDILLKFLPNMRAVIGYNGSPIVTYITEGYRELAQTHELIDTMHNWSCLHCWPYWGSKSNFSKSVQKYL